MRFDFKYHFLPVLQLISEYQLVIQIEGIGTLNADTGSAKAKKSGGKQ